MKRMILALSLVAMTATSAFAGPGDGDLINILKNASTRDQLALPVEKLSQINNLFATMEKQIADALNKVKPDIKVAGFSIGKAPDPFNMVEKLQGEFRKQMMKLLDGSQLQQALKLGIKAEGNFAFLMPEVAKEVNLDKGTRRSIEDYRKQYLELKKTLDGQVRKGTLTDDERLAQLSLKDAELQKLISGIVKPEFFEKLKAFTDRS